MSKRSRARDGGRRAGRGGAAVLTKMCSADVELGNFIQGFEAGRESCREASRAILREFDGVPSTGETPCQTREGNVWVLTDVGVRLSTNAFDPQDWGRKFLYNGGCAYIDLNHIEICLPEVRSASDHVAAWHAALRTVRAAVDKANGKLPPGRKIQVLVNNSDGQGNSYGSHLNFLISRAAWNDLFLRKSHYQAYLAAFQTSSIVFTGQGKVGSENGAPPVDYQLSQRADFCESMSGYQTTFRRPIVNSRDEPLAGHGMARLHVIFYDSNLAQTACYLKVGTLQILLAMIEQGRVNPSLALDDPVDAVVRWSHDPALSAKAKTVGGRRLTALEMQFRFLEEARRFVDRGDCAGLVPECERILALWQDTLQKLADRDEEGLMRRLDWMLKLKILEEVIRRHPALGWDSPEIKVLDQIYGNLALDEGIFWQYEREGRVDVVVAEERIAELTHEPPADTRAWTRAMLLRQDPARVEEVGWDEVRFRAEAGDDPDVLRSVRLDSPLGFTQDETAEAFRFHDSLDGILDALGATEEHRPATTTTASGWSSSGGTYPERRWSHDTLS